ncbi:MAG: methylated-DNA--[protein]-cysteine S-methyltransferase [Thermotogaceae bacterium]|nr:methylated-DNA--[protein]-cysteine S-methyltransferase [Thermotogaceae bacterium]
MVQTVVGTCAGPVSILIDEGRAVKIKLGQTFKDVPEFFVEPFYSIIKAYFEGRIKLIDFPVKLEGTEFLNRVWQQVRKIPYGSVMTYGQVAKIVGTSPRAIGLAMRLNPLPLYIPCHRVIAKKGLGGFGPGLEWKRFLLELEGVLL